MKRVRWNAWVDGLALIIFVLLASTGLVLSFQLPPGSGGREALGAGHGAGEKTVVLLWGLSRHEWGEIHYWLSLGVLAVLALHLLLHWKWILCLFKPTGKHDYSGTRLALGVFGLGLLLVMALAPHVAETSRIDRSALATDTDAVHDENLEVRGSMTLEQIANTTGVPVDVLVEQLGLPAETPPDAQAGRLLREHGQSMTELRDVVREFLANEQ